MSHKEAFEMLEGQLMNLHSSAQNMANLYCTQQSLQTLLIANPSNRSKEEPKPEKKQDDAMTRKIEEISTELRVVKNKLERETNQLKKTIEDDRSGNQGRASHSTWQQPPQWQPRQQPPHWQPPADQRPPQQQPPWSKPPYNNGEDQPKSFMSHIVDSAFYNKSLMTHFSQLLRKQIPKNLQVLRDQVTNEVIPWASSYYDTFLTRAIPDGERRKHLIILMGAQGCRFCAQILKNQGGDKPIFPHLLFKNNIPDKPNQATIYSFPRCCPMLHTATLEARQKLLTTFPSGLYCNNCLRNSKYCICNLPPEKTKTSAHLQIVLNI